MQKKYFYFTTLLFISISMLTSCRTMQLNQAGKTLGKGVYESAAGGGVGIVGGAMSTTCLAMNINAEFQQRFGIGERTEVQLKVHNDFTASGGYYYTFAFSQQNEIDFAVKINTYDKNGYAFSLLPFGGTAFGMSNHGIPPKNYFVIPTGENSSLLSYVCPNTGLALIGSKSGLKYNFYWGGTFNLSPSIWHLVFGAPAFETDFTFNWGWEIPKDRIVYRHEIDLFCQINWMGVPFINFGLSYHFSAGVRYNPGQRQMRE
ncbi:MAG: hypothetical protein J6W76_06075 [Spirochaetales bacterium]|nr:hypothetical protein [Spirochaetales bacterium]